MRKIYFTILTLFVAVTLNAQTMNGWVTNPSFETIDNSTSTGAADWELVLSNGAKATATVVTAADAGTIPDGTYAIKVVVTNIGTGNHTDVKLVNTVNDFSDYYTVPDNGNGLFECKFSWEQHAVISTENQVQLRIVFNEDGKDIGTNSASLSQTKKNTVAGWEAFNATKTNNNSSPDKIKIIDPNNLTFRQDIAFAYQTGTYYIDNITSEVVGAVEVPTAIGDVKNDDLKIWSTNRAVKVMNKAGKTGLATVYDLSGRQITQVQLSANENTIEMPQGGLYIVKSTIDGNVFTQKVVVK